MGGALQVQTRGHVRPSLGTRTVVLSIRENVRGSAEATNIWPFHSYLVGAFGGTRVLNTCFLELSSSGEVKVLPRVGQELWRKPGDTEAENPWICGATSGDVDMCPSTPSLHWPARLCS